MPRSPQSIARRQVSSLRHWAATAEDPPARWLRRGLRGALRVRARLGKGSVAAYMDSVVADATSGDIGSGLTPTTLARRRHRRLDREDRLERAAHASPAYSTAEPTGQPG